MRDPLAERKQRLLYAATSYIEEAQTFINILDQRYPDTFVQRSDELRRKLEAVLDRLHEMVRDNRILEAVSGFGQLIDIMTDFSTSVAREVDPSS